MFLEHGLALADVRIAFEQSALLNGCTIEVWHDEMDIRHSRDHDRVMVPLPGKPSERVPILPDGYFQLAIPRGRGHFFMEVDRSTETIIRKWQRKMVGYKEYVLSGGFHRRYGVSRRQTALRILTTTPSLQRAQNLKVAAERYGPAEASPLFLFAPFDQVTSQDALVAPIWFRAGDARQCAIL